MKADTAARIAWLLAAVVCLVAAWLVISHSRRHHPNCGHGESSMAISHAHGKTIVIRPAYRTGC